MRVDHIAPRGPARGHRDGGDLVLGAARPRAARQGVHDLGELGAPEARVLGVRRAAQVKGAVVLVGRHEGVGDVVLADDLQDQREPAQRRVDDLGDAHRAPVPHPQLAPEALGPRERVGLDGQQPVVPRADVDVHARRERHPADHPLEDLALAQGQQGPPGRRGGLVGRAQALLRLGHVDGRRLEQDLVLGVPAAGRAGEPVGLVLLVDLVREERVEELHGHAALQRALLRVRDLVLRPEVDVLLVERDAGRPGAVGELDELGALVVAVALLELELGPRVRDPGDHRGALLLSHEAAEEGQRAAVRSCACACVCACVCVCVEGTRGRERGRERK